jgi:lactate dehydrogenase-like 2-hydroxyacid dehydrogenase
MKPTVLMAPRLPDSFATRLAEHYRVLGPLSHSAPEALPPEAGAVRALLTMGTLRTDAALIEALPALELIALYGTGFEGVDRAFAAKRGIAICNAGTANAASVAEYAIGLILATTRTIVAGDRFIRSGQWQGNSVERMPMVPGFGGRRLGIYGLGAIGSRIAARAAAFEVEIGYHNRNPRSDMPYFYHDSLPGLADWADILVVAARAGAENRHAINAKVLAALGPQGHLVNISRGMAIDETALCEALERGTIAGAGLDVFEAEPNVSDRLKVLGNVVLTPHIAGNSISAQRGQQAMMLANLEAHFTGRPVVSPV